MRRTRAPISAGRLRRCLCGSDLQSSRRRPVIAALLGTEVDRVAAAGELQRLTRDDVRTADGVSYHLHGWGRRGPVCPAAYSRSALNNAMEQAPDRARKQQK